VAASPAAEYSSWMSMAVRVGARPQCAVIWNTAKEKKTPGPGLRHSGARHRCEVLLRKPGKRRGRGECRRKVSLS